MKMNDSDNLIGTPFREDGKTKKSDRPIPVRLDKRDERMLKNAMYAYNMHSKSGTLKLLARLGYRKVLQGGYSIEEMHYLTRGDRTRVITEKPDLSEYI